VIEGTLDDEPRAAWAPDEGLFAIATAALYEVPPDASRAVAVGAGQFGGDIDVAP
jgi:hypothetical protein